MKKQRGYMLIAFLMVVIVALVAIGGAMHFHEKAAQEKELRAAAENALGTERELRQIGNRSANELRADLAKQKERADANRRKLHDALASGPDCHLPAPAGGVLRNLTSEGDAGAAAAGAGGAPAQADPAAGGGAGAGAPAEAEGERPVSCRAVAVWAQRNLDEVLTPNAEQLRKVQEHYESVRRRLNEATRP